MKASDLASTLDALASYASASDEISDADGARYSAAEELDGLDRRLQRQTHR